MSTKGVYKETRATIRQVKLEQSDDEATHQLPPITYVPAMENDNYHDYATTAHLLENDNYDDYGITETTVETSVDFTEVDITQEIGMTSGHELIDQRSESQDTPVSVGDPVTTRRLTKDNLLKDISNTVALSTPGNKARSRLDISGHASLKEDLTLSASHSNPTPTTLYFTKSVFKWYTTCKLINTTVTTQKAHLTTQNSAYL
jgi:hypothetical protein